MQEFGLERLGIDDHGPELWEVEFFAPFANPFLPEENGATIGQFDGEGDDAEEG